MNTAELMQILPWLGWVLLLLGWLGQRRIVQKQVQVWVNKVTVMGAHNHIQNSAEFQHSPSAAHDCHTKNASALERWSQRATVAGLFISLWPLLKGNGGI